MDVLWPCSFHAEDLARAARIDTAVVTRTSNELKNTAKPCSYYAQFVLTTFCVLGEGRFFFTRTEKFKDPKREIYVEQPTFTFPITNTNTCSNTRLEGRACLFPHLDIDDCHDH